MATEPSYHAIYVVLDDADFFPASLRSVYDHISGATVITSYDVDRWGGRIEPDSVIGGLLSRELDPDRKVNVVAATDLGEAQLRNRAMAFARPPRRPRRVHRMSGGQPMPDWFWIIDADEIYDERAIAGLKAYVASHRANTYLIRPTSYFRTWNWRIEDPGHSVVVVRPGFWFSDLRHRYLTPWVRLFRKLAHVGVLPRDLAFRAFGARCVPIEVATFHHGNYVGDRARIETKLARSGHRDETSARWLDDVWDRWTPAATDFHPQVPDAFPKATHVPTGGLPRAITEHAWPDGWIDRST